jgi:hypothetical protein
MHLSGEEGEREYGHVIRLLRADPRAAAAVADLWIRAAAGDSMLRWSLLYIVAEIEDPACLDVLRHQAMHELPERMRGKGICEQASDYEELVAVMAIEGLGRLAAAGNAQAEDALIEVVAHQHRKSLRQPAAAALLAVRADLRTRVEEMLSENERYVLNLREATDADLQVQLVHKDRDRKPKRRDAHPKPPLTERGGSAPVAPCGSREGR